LAIVLQKNRQLDVYVLFPRMKRAREITQEAFDRLLTWLDADRELAGRKYETIRLRLIKLFACRGCAEPEDLADDTIDRVILKLPELIPAYTGDKSLYFYGVAHRVHLEDLRYRRPPPTPPPPPPDPADPDEENLYDCLDQCLDNLPGETRRLVVEYYQEVKRAKIDHRRKLAMELGIAVNALRIRAHRIRMQLQVCVTSCLESKPAN
jgi:DNA-directed RNA polymerase specialized sigma24 family protein